jgi:hypothetical protein
MSSPQPPHSKDPFAATSLTLPAVTESVRTARRFVMKVLTDLDAPGACDDAVALVSELATNAVIHAQTAYTIVVSRDAGTVRVVVHDLSAVIPRLRVYGSNATTGRGLRLVATISTVWGIAPEPAGKAVWFEVGCESGREVPAWDPDVDVDASLHAYDDDIVEAPTATRALPV